MNRLIIIPYSLGSLADKYKNRLCVRFSINEYSIMSTNIALILISLLIQHELANCLFLFYYKVLSVTLKLTLIE